MTNTILIILAVAVISYLFGSIMFAIIVSRVLKHEDVRDHGSGNAGMTNILRLYGKGPAVITAIGDFLKGVAAIVISRILFKHAGITFVDAGYIAGLFVLLGHVYPVYFGFRGGKGVMTTLGIILAVNPIVFLILAIIFVPLVFITKIVSISSIFGAIAFPVFTYIMAVLRDRPAALTTAFACVYTVVIVFMHRANIKRLLNGTENKFGQKKES